MPAGKHILSVQELCKLARQLGASDVLGLGCGVGEFLSVEDNWIAGLENRGIRDVAENAKRMCIEFRQLQRAGWTVDVPDADLLHWVVTMTGPVIIM